MHRYELFFSVLPTNLSISSVYENSLCPLSNDIAPWSHVTMVIKHSIKTIFFREARTLYHYVLLYM